MEVAHELYLPTTLIKSRTDLPLGQNIRSLEFHNSSLSKEKADNPALDSPGVFL
jgi:hypothetical protein